MAENEVDVFGVGILGPPPLGMINLELTPGLSVLYGVNGAGKTRVLDAVRAAFRARSDSTLRSGRGAAMLYARWTPDADGLVTSRMRAAASDVWKNFNLRSGDDLVDVPEWLFPESEPLDIAAGIVELESDGNRELAREVVDQQLLVLINGDLWLGASISDLTPELQRLWNSNRTMARRTIELATKPEEARAEQALRYAVGELEPDSPPFMLRAAWEVELNSADAPPPWVPLPIVSLGPYYGSFGEALSDAAFDAEEQTVSYLRSVGMPLSHPPTYRSLLTGSDLEGVTVDQEVCELAVHLSARASDLAAMLMLDGPVLRCDLRDPNDWALGRTVEWQAYDSPSMVWVKLEDLSRAQQRWAFVAIQIALREGARERISVIVLDEPEEALHARAERHLIAGLEQLSAETSVPVVVASHSADALRSPKAKLLHVSRDGRGLTRVDILRSAARDTIDELGLDPIDVLQLVRVFVVVEGHHDKLILDSLLRDELHRLRAELLPARGASQIATITDSQLIFDYTSASALVLVDNASADDVRAVWDDARELARNSDTAGARKALDQGFSRKVAEERFLKEFCWKAIERGQLDRVDVWALQMPDIVMYLPADHLVPSEPSWEALRERHAAHSGKDFKSWLVADCDADFSDEALLTAIASMDAIPPEFSELINRVSELGDWRRRGPHATGD